MFQTKDASSANKKTVRIGLIGHMFMGRAHSNAFRNAAQLYDLPCNVAMTAVCAKDTSENLAAFAARFGWESCETDWRKLVARKDIDLVSVATPGNLHKEMVLEAARHGKHILCEKPLANSLPDAEQMLAAVQKAGVKHCCGFSYRGSPAQALARQFVEQGKIGKIHHVYARYAQDWSSSPGFPMVWRFDKHAAGSGSLGDIAAHSIDATRFITGLKFTEIIGNLKTIIPERPMRADDPTGPKQKCTVDDVAQFLCNFDNGAVGCFEATRMAVGRKNANRIEVNGEKGSLVWDFSEQNYLYYYDRTEPAAQQGFRKIDVTNSAHPFGGGPWPDGHGIGYADCLMIEVANFLKVVCGESAPNADFSDGVECQRVLDAVERSAAERKWITLGGR